MALDRLNGLGRCLFSQITPLLMGEREGDLKFLVLVIACLYAAYVMDLFHW